MNRTLNTMHHAIAEVAITIVDDNTHGYSQINRDGNGSYVTYYIPSIKDWVIVHGGDYDCSSMVYEVLKTLNILPVGLHFWTGNEDEILINHGFKRMNCRKKDALIGDILYREGHTGIYVGNDTVAEFVSSEFGTITGAEGDQTGNEGKLSKFVAIKWDYIYRLVDYIGVREALLMPCIIRIVDTEAAHIYYDGVAVHSMGDAQELKLLDEIARANGYDQMPRVFWSAKKYNNFVSLINRKK